MLVGRCMRVPLNGQSNASLAAVGKGLQQLQLQLQTGQGRGQARLQLQAGQGRMRFLHIVS